MRVPFFPLLSFEIFPLIRLRSSTHSFCVFVVVVAVIVSFSYRFFVHSVLPLSIGRITLSEQRLNMNQIVRHFVANPISLSLPLQSASPIAHCLSVCD